MQKGVEDAKYVTVTDHLPTSHDTQSMHTEILAFNMG